MNCFFSLVVSSLKQSMEQPQQINQSDNKENKENKEIRLIKSGKSYVYQGKYYKLGNSQICENMDVFAKILSSYCSKHESLKLNTTRYRNLHSSNKRIISSRIKTIKHYIQLFVMFNQNYELLLNLINMHYSLTSMKQKGKQKGKNYSPLIPICLVKAEEALTYFTNHIENDREISGSLHEKIRNKGIRETKLCIEIITGRLAYNREKIVLLSRILFARHIDSNVATIIYQYYV